MVVSSHMHSPSSSHSIAQELYNSLVESCSLVVETFSYSIHAARVERKKKALASHIEKGILDILDNAHAQNAKFEKIRDYVQMYHINDVETDEKILMQFSDFIEEKSELIEMVLDSKELTMFPNEVESVMRSAFEELYSTMVNTNFLISQKIAQAYLDSKDDFELLEEA